MSRPILLTGPDRSGTSLLFALLGSHPNISMVRRTNMFRWFHGRFGDLSDPVNFERCLDTMLRYERLSPLQPDPDRIRREFVAGDHTYGYLFDRLHSHHAERMGRPRWGDKSLHTEHHAAAVFSEFPDARMIQVMRDPRDRHASVMRRYPDVSRKVGPVTGRWLASERAGGRNLRHYPGRYRLVRYEDLVGDPEGVLADLCDFLDEPYTSAMLSMGGVPEHEKGNSSFEQFAPGTISTKGIGRYRTALDRRDVAFIESVGRRAMKRLGYQPDTAALRLGDVPYVAENAARMMAWIAADPERRGRAEVPASRLSPEPITT
jgi:hypothetical protein